MQISFVGTIFTLVISVFGATTLVNVTVVMNDDDGKVKICVLGMLTGKLGLSPSIASIKIQYTIIPQPNLHSNN